MELCMLLTLGVMKPKLILSHPIRIHRRETNLGDFIKNDSAGLHSDIYGLISFKLGIMIETTQFYGLISVRMSGPSFKVILV